MFITMGEEVFFLTLTLATFEYAIDWVKNENSKKIYYNITNVENLLNIKSVMPGISQRMFCIKMLRIIFAKEP